MTDEKCWKCGACGGRVGGRSVDKASSPDEVCKGYCFDEANCVGKACPDCGEKHCWTYSPETPGVWPADRYA